MNKPKVFRGILARKHDIESGEKNGKQWTKEVFTIEEENPNPNWPKIVAFTAMNGKGNVSGIPIGATIEVTAYIDSKYSRNKNTGAENYFHNMSVNAIQVVGTQQASTQYQQPQNQYAQPQQGYPAQQKVVTPQRSDDDSDNLPF